LAKVPVHMLRLATDTYIIRRCQVVAGFARIPLHEDVRVTHWDKSKDVVSEIMAQHLKDLQRVELKCLRCKKPFMSEGPHNRMCDLCRTDSVVEDYKLEL